MSSPIPFNNDQPTLALTEFQVVQGIFPARPSSLADEQADPGGIPLGAIRLFAGSVHITQELDGQILPINTNQALFSLLGNFFGGNGTTNFAVPNAQGTVLVGTGQGNGLANETLGQSSGSDAITLNPAQMPASVGGNNATFDNHQASLGITYMINAGGKSTTGGDDLVGMVVPTGANFAGDGYLPAQGQLVLISDFPALFAAIGTHYGGDGVTTFALPDLNGRTIVGASAQEPLGTKFGGDVSVTSSELPVTAGGQGAPVDNHQPSLAMNYLISVVGVFPSDDSGFAAAEADLGEVMAYAGTTIPQGWVIAAGQILQINQNQALFALLGTTYGGDGVRTFALPDLRGHAVIGTGFSPSFGSVVLGQTNGADTVTLAKNQIIDGAPHLTGFDASLLGVDHVFQKIAAHAVASDGNLDLMNGGAGDYAGASLTLARHGGGVATDTFGFDTSGANFTVSGTDLQSGGHTFASFTNTGGELTSNHPGVLTITFNSSGTIATTALVNDVLDHITYAHAGNGALASSVFDLVLSDGNTGAQGTGGPGLTTTPAIDTHSITVNDNVPPAHAVSDFNGDDHSDILWHNDNGSNSIWDSGQIGNAHIISSAGAVDSSWHIVGKGDFDGDGHSDILWHNDNGSNSIWDSGQIGNAHIISAAGGVASTWHIVGTGDFDGNGHDDILWHNDNGANSIWDNGQIGSAHIISNAGDVASSWHIVGTGDFDQNGHTDILWHNDNGANSIWDNGQIGGGHIISNAGDVASTWHIVGTGDFDGNGHSDILWQNDNGAVSIWDNGQIAGAHGIANPGVVAASWHIAGTGDFDGNGHDDILWHNDNGANSIWDNGQINSAHIIADAGVVANSWHIV